MERRVLVTRPQPGTTRTAAKLAQTGYVPIELPLTRISALRVEPFQVVGTYSAVAVTSPNAILHAPPELIAELKGTACFAVGSQTGDAARRAGFASVIDHGGNSDALSVAIQSGVPAGGSILYLCGRTRTPDLESTLVKAGVSVHAAEVYEAQSISYDAMMLETIVGSEPIFAVMLYSPRAADLLMACPWSHVARRQLAEARYLCLSVRIARRLAGFREDRIEIAECANDDSMLQLLA